MRAALKAFATVAKKKYDRNRVRMDGDLAGSQYNLSLSLPNLCHLKGWLPEWNVHVVDITPSIEEIITRGMLRGEQREAGLQNMMEAVE
jgi:hypothetical protein